MTLILKYRATSTDNERKFFKGGNYKSFPSFILFVYIERENKRENNSAVLCFINLII
jgi:hypothetical protein